MKVLAESTNKSNILTTETNETQLPVNSGKSKEEKSKDKYWPVPNKLCM